MEIQSVDIAQERIQQEAAIQVQRMAQEEIQAQSAALEKLYESAEVITDPAVGNNLELWA